MPHHPDIKHCLSISHTKTDFYFQILSRLVPSRGGYFEYDVDRQRGGFSAHGAVQGANQSDNKKTFKKLMFNSETAQRDVRRERL